MTWNVTEDIQNNNKAVSPFIVIGVNTGTITNLIVKSNGIWITVTEDLTAWDILYINWETWDVLLNWVDIDWDWVFPILKTWGNNFTITPTGTFTADVQVYYANKLM